VTDRSHEPVDLSRLAAVVLAGGASRRMGTDKALLVLEGQRLVDRAVEVVGEVAMPDLVVVASGTRHLHGMAVDQVTDEVADAGPLAGIAAGLAWCRDRGASAAVVVAVDLVWASPALLAAAAARLARVGHGGLPDVVVPFVGGRAQPLHAAWRTDVAVDLARAVAAGRRGVIAELANLRVDRWTGWASLDPPARFMTNVNRPQDLPRG